MRGGGAGSGRAKLVLTIDCERTNIVNGRN